MNLDASSKKPQQFISTIHIAVTDVAITVPYLRNFIFYDYLQVTEENRT